MSSLNGSARQCPIRMLMTKTNSAMGAMTNTQVHGMLYTIRQKASAIAEPRMHRSSDSRAKYVSRRRVALTPCYFLKR